MKKAILSALSLSSRNLIAFAALFAFGALFLSACTKKETEQTASKKVHLAIWSNYVTPEALEEFKKETGIEVEISNYSSNEELLAKLQAGASGIDVAVPSDYMVQTMVELGLAEAIDQAQIPNFKDTASNLLGLYFDPQNQYSVPFGWGTTGIAINTNLVKVDVKSWKDLFNNPELKGKYSLLDDVRETLGAALKSTGKSLNSVAELEVNEAKAVLMQARENVRAFTSETQPGLVSGDLPIAHAYSCDALQARAKTNGAIKYVIPEEGATRWVDNLVIPKGAKNKAEAHALINFLISPKIGAERAQRLYTAPANLKSMDLLPKELKEDAALFPSAEVLARTEMLKDLGNSLSLWDKNWTEVRASR